MLSNSENETGGVHMTTSPHEIIVKGTKWERIQEGSASGRLPLHNTFKVTSGPTGNAQRSIVKDK